MVERRVIPDTFGYYEADSEGNIWSCARVVASTRYPSGTKKVRERILKPFLDKRGYGSVHLGLPDGYRRGNVHQLVAAAFHGPKPESAECVRHLDDNPRNNRPENLAYGTFLDNVADSIRNGTFPRAEKNGAALLTNAQVIEIKERILAGARTGELAREYDVSAQAISCLKSGRNWASIGPQIPREDRAIFADIGGVKVPLKKYVRRVDLCYESVRFRVRRRGETVSEAARSVLKNGRRRAA